MTSLSGLVVSQGLAKQLKVAGLKQRSNFYWYRKLNYPLWSLLANEYDPKEVFEYEGSDPCEWMAAYMSDELLAVLPASCYVATRKRGGATASSGGAFHKQGITETTQADTPANALARLYISLFEQGHIKHKEAV